MNIIMMKQTVDAPMLKGSNTAPNGLSSSGFASILNSVIQSSSASQMENSDHAETSSGNLFLLRAQNVHTVKEQEVDLNSLILAHYAQLTALNDDEQAVPNGEENISLASELDTDELDAVNSENVLPVNNESPKTETEIDTEAVTVAPAVESEGDNYNEALAQLIGDTTEYNETLEDEISSQRVELLKKLQEAPEAAEYLNKLATELGVTVDDLADVAASLGLSADELMSELSRLINAMEQKELPSDDVSRVATSEVQELTVTMNDIEADGTPLAKEPAVFDKLYKAIMERAAGKAPQDNANNNINNNTWADAKSADAINIGAEQHTAKTLDKTVGQTVDKTIAQSGVQPTAQLIDKVDELAGKATIAPSTQSALSSLASGNENSGKANINTQTVPAEVSQATAKSAEKASADAGQAGSENKDSADSQSADGKSANKNSFTVLESTLAKGAVQADDTAATNTKDVHFSDKSVQLNGHSTSAANSDTLADGAVKREEAVLRWESARDAVDFAKLVQQAGRNGVTKLTVRLNPENLGKIEIQLAETLGKVNAKIITASQEARNLIATNVDAIKHALADKGIQINNMDFNFHDSTTKQGNNSFGEQQANGSNGSNGKRDGSNAGHGNGNNTGKSADGVATKEVATAKGLYA